VPRDLPKKSPTVKLKQAAMQDRARQLDEYLQAIVQREPLILQCDDMLAFLEVQLYDVHGICYMLLANLVPDGLGMARLPSPAMCAARPALTRRWHSANYRYGRGHNHPGGHLFSFPLSPTFVWAVETRLKELVPSYQRGMCPPRCHLRLVSATLTKRCALSAEALSSRVRFCERARGPAGRPAPAVPDDPAHGLCQGRARVRAMWRVTRTRANCVHSSFMIVDTQLSSGYWRRPDSEIDDTELAYEEPLYNIAIFESATALHVRRGPATASSAATQS